MKIKDIALSAAYVGQRVVKAICVGAQEVWSAVKYIVFKDPVVAQICAENWGDGSGITEEQAAAVTDIGTVFKGNTEIEYFPEFEKFSGITSIADYDGFSKCSNLKSINVPKSITSYNAYSFNECSQLSFEIDFSEVVNVGKYAFYASKLYGSANLAKVQSIGTLAFAYTNIRSASLYEGITELKNGIFRECLELENVHLPSSLLVIKNQAFEKCSKLKTSIPQSVTTIDAYAFMDCVSLVIEDLVLPNLTSLGSAVFRTVPIYRASNLGRITSIPGSCFKMGHLRFVNIPSTVTSIGSEAFSTCPLETVICNNPTPPTITANSFYGIDKTSLSVYVPDQSVQAYREASGWSAYADRIWPMEAYLYGIITFADPAVEAICLANWDTNGSGYLNKEEAKAVTDIGTVFKGNTEITSFDELEGFIGVTKLNSNDTEANAPFMGCTSLASVKIPQNVTEIGERSFSGCTSLTEVGSLENVQKFGRWAFANTLIGGELSLPNITEIKHGAFQNTRIKKVVSLGSISSFVGGEVFSKCSELEEVTIPNTLTNIGAQMFYECEKLTYISSLHNIRTIGSFAFYGCSNLKVKISAPNLTYLEQESFRGSGIISVDNLGSITSVNQRAFMQCSNLIKIVIPSTVTSFNGVAIFYECSALKALIMEPLSPPTLLNTGVFANSSIAKGEGTIYVPDASVVAYKTAEHWSAYADQIKPLSQYVES